MSGNHTAYKQVKGTKTTAEEMLNLYEGLQQSNLTNFDVLLTGYVPSAEAVQAIGKIGRDVKFNAGTKPGSFFWGALPEFLNALSSTDLRQFSILSWAIMASYTFRKTKCPSTRVCSERPISFSPINLRLSRSACIRGVRDR